MSQISLALTNSRIIGEISLDPTKITGEGGLTDARLVFPLQIRVNPSSFKNAMIALTELGLLTPFWWANLRTKSIGAER